MKETSYYPALANLLNAVGQTLKPRVRCCRTSVPAFLTVVYSLPINSSANDGNALP